MRYTISYCRTKKVEFNSEKDADEGYVDYSKNTVSEFPEPQILLGIRTVPTSGVVVPVYPDKETAKNTAVARNARMGNCTREDKCCDV